MRDQWRVAYTFEGPSTKPLGRVLVLYMDRYSKESDPWDDLHNLFGLKSPAAGHDKPPCCEAPLQALDAESLDMFEGRVANFLLTKHGL
ncbi:MAG: hypothetical protein ACR2MY_06765 [Candidatus Dormibacteria bacterium]